MSFISKLLYGWHFVRRNYHEELLASCIDSKLKKELHTKYEYHEYMLEQLSVRKAS